MVAQLKVEALQDWVLGNDSVDLVHDLWQESIRRLANDSQKAVDNLVSVWVHVDGVDVVVQVLEVSVGQINDSQINQVVFLDGELELQVELGNVGEGEVPCVVLYLNIPLVQHSSGEFECLVFVKVNCCSIQKVELNVQWLVSVSVDWGAEESTNGLGSKVNLMLWSKFVDQTSVHLQVGNIQVDDSVDQRSNGILVN